MGYKQDYLKKQIDQMARVLGALLTDILGLKNEGKILEIEAQIERTFVKDLGFNFDEVMKTEPVKLIEYLMENKSFEEVHLNHVGNILFELGIEKSKASEKQKYYERALVIFEYLQSISTTYSFDYMIKVNRMKEELNEKN